MAEMPDLAEILDGIYRKYFLLIDELNELSVSLRKNMLFHSNDYLELIATPVYFRTLPTYQAAIILSRKGMPHQPNMLLRCILESTFQLVAISKNKESAAKLVGSEVDVWSS